MRKATGGVEHIKYNMELDEAIELHKTGWKVQKVGWVVIFGIVVFAGLGLFGSGPLSKKTLQQSNIKVDYDRFFRYEAAMKIKVESEGDASINTVAVLQEYLKEFKVEKIFPEPKENKTEAGSVIYTFEGGQNRSVVFHIIPKKVGNITGSWIINNTPFQLSHFIYP